MLSAITRPMSLRKSVRQPARVATTLPCQRRPCSNSAFLPRQRGCRCATAANFWSTASISDLIRSAANTAWPIDLAWSFHGSKNASPPDWATVGAIADSC
ncbi:Uncharacterised protein [Mycobacterium tuberculosis]|nr:Uncharacterised protein [Mycobacterium tuberculosis]